MSDDGGLDRRRTGGRSPEDGSGLIVLAGTRWQGEEVPGDRPTALLAALVLAAPRAVPVDQLVEEVWDQTPDHPEKALQVLVSRTRSRTSPAVIERSGRGYRLGLDADRVDLLRMRSLVEEGRASWSPGPLVRALEIPLVAPGGDRSRFPGPARLHTEALRLQDRARRLLGQVLLDRGEAQRALPVLEQSLREHPDDESALVPVLRAEAVVRGVPAALERYAAHAARVRESLGAEPGEELRRLHADLLARDAPVREGLAYDPTPLIGRDRDVAELRSLLATSRVVSVVGAGGLGKTRLAHVVGREWGTPVVQFVELVGVTAAEDLVGEVGSALGVRDSVTGRRRLTPEQRRDVRGRIAEYLDRAPSLLILDNCEHIVAAVADLVAFLAATTRDLRVLTTSRSPLAIAAERVYPLGELGPDDAARLFRQRALAARPGAKLDERAVAEVVDRLDGLPLAIELAAAKVRVMSVADIARRLENRFALLRGGDRSAPDRHQTLLAVIDWSWNLLDTGERRALRWLSMFHDGFTLPAAEAVLGAEALGAVQSLADQSLLAVHETTTGVRYRMLETVREFGRMQLVDAGEDEAARRAQRDWATEFAREQSDRLFSPEQYDAMDTLAAEEGNLADVLRQVLGEPDPAAVVQLLGGLGGFWSVRGDHVRVIALAGAVGDAVRDWDPPAELADAARLAMSLTLNNAMIAADDNLGPVRALLRRLGDADNAEDPRVRAITRVMLSYDPGRPTELLTRLEELGEDPDHRVASSALQWVSHAYENIGDLGPAIVAAERSLDLSDPADGPWGAAILHAHLAQLHAQRGELPRGLPHARAALPVLQRLGATDDVVQLRGLEVAAALEAARFDEAEAELARLHELGESAGIFGGTTIVQMAEAELALVRGDVAGGVRGYVESADRLRELRFPGLESTGHEPWVLYGDAVALTVLALHADAELVPVGEQRFATCVSHVLVVLDEENPFLDYPVTGALLFGVAAWALLRGGLTPDDAARFLVLAERFGYSRLASVMAWDPIAERAEVVAPGALEKGFTEFGGRRGPELLQETRALVRSLAPTWGE